MTYYDLATYGFGKRIGRNITAAELAYYHPDATGGKFEHHFNFATANKMLNLFNRNFFRQELGMQGKEFPLGKYKWIALDEDFGIYNIPNFNFFHYFADEFKNIVDRVFQAGINSYWESMYQYTHARMSTYIEVKMGPRTNDFYPIELKSYIQMAFIPWIIFTIEYDLVRFLWVKSVITLRRFWLIARDRFKKKRRSNKK